MNKSDTHHGKRFLFIVQRYGMDVDGGAELYCRWLAETLIEYHDIEILTTCAKDYGTWENAYSEGLEIINGIPVHRFPVDRTRRMDTFNRQTAELLTTQPTREAQINWLNAQGPVSSQLLDYIEENHHHYQALVFFTYLYHPSVTGSAIAPDRSYLIPTAHDEPVAHFQIFHEMYRRVAGLLYLTPAESRFVQSTYEVSQKPQTLLGTGIDLPISESSSVGFLNKYQLKPPLLLYIGRVEPGKGCEELVEFHEKYRQEKNAESTLVFAGRNRLNHPETNHLRFLGFIPDEDIVPALQAADVICVPSPFESLSILLLQALKMGKPVLANNRSNVLKDHCTLSNAGLVYASLTEFIEMLDLLETRRDLRKIMGLNGKKYIEHNYTWSIVTARFNQFFQNISAN